MIHFLTELHAYCVSSQRQQGELSTIMFDDDNVYNTSVYDMAILGDVPTHLCDKAQIIEIVHAAMKFIFASSADMYGDPSYYNPFRDAICCCLAKMDYYHLLRRYAGIIDYDFYTICMEEGLTYDRYHYICIVYPEVAMHYSGCKLFTNSEAIKYIAKELGKYRCKSDGILLKLNDDVYLQDNVPDDYENGIICQHVSLFDNLLSNAEFNSMVLKKLPYNIQKALIERDKRILNGQLTLLAFYVQAIHAEYGCRFGVKITDKVFAAPLGINYKNFSRYRDKKAADMAKKYGDYTFDSNLKILVEQFPKYESILRRKLAKSRKI